ncbi:arabinose efflux permease family protein [Thermus oshimai JL-2]|uniref:Arabinose efflux permease family protein n=1 Tax=Thermus oshimai JL-2 TaxID=751945 RepID=K7R7E0_THEOS|nr:MFS transporter [Thermus oshimai]AFV76884.1 arabinose efflux permease family protein [Thermus oshimai JL-2]
MQGFAAFRLLWAGQALALLGREASWFALTLFAYQKTGLATTLSLLAFFHFLPLLLFSPLAGALVDRWPRKRALFLSDLGGGVAAGFLLLLFLLGELQVFHLYLVSAFTGALSSLHWPALSASISAMLDKKDYARASGLLSLAESLAGIGGPILGAALLKPMGLGGVLLLELLGAVAAVTTLLLVAIPSPKPAPGPQLSLLQETLFGFRYILARPPLLGLQLMFFAVNFLYSLAATALPAMVLSKTAFSEEALALVRSAAGVGGVAGGLFLSLWGGPRKRVHGVFWGMALSSLSLALLGAVEGAWAWAFLSFWESFFIPLLNGSNQAIWQAKVPLEVQGKVFAARRMIAWMANPLGMLLSGVLADRVFGPRWGQGEGIALMLLLFGGMGVLVGLLGYLIPVVREAEERLEDAKA